MAVPQDEAERPAVAEPGGQPEARADTPEAAQKKPAGWLSWAVAVAGWLMCAALCLWLTIALEAWPSLV